MRLPVSVSGGEWGTMPGLIVGDDKENPTSSVSEENTQGTVQWHTEWHKCTVLELDTVSLCVSMTTE